MKNIHQNKTVRDRFFAPLYDALKVSTATRDCPSFTDQQFLESGVDRVIGNTESGRDWVQNLQTVFGVDVSVGNFFMTLKSERRLSLSVDISNHVRMQLDKLTSRENDDPLATHPELDGFAIYASDGHTHSASAHEELIVEKKRSVTHIYSLNLRSHSITPLALTGPREGMKKEHEISALKRIGAKELRMNEAKGTKVIHVYDPAIIDYRQWYNWKHSDGIYVVTKEKSNSALITVGALPWEPNDPRNNGVVSDELVESSNGFSMRRITYIDPVTGVIYRFITNEMTIPPGLIAFIYKLRWDIEKVFDVFKNKEHEKKAWAGTKEAKSNQALFIALAHNLMRILEITLKKEEGITDKSSEKKRQARLKSDEKKAKSNGRAPNELVMQWKRITQRCVQFIRWLRYCLTAQTCWKQSVCSLRPLMEKILL